MVMRIVILSFVATALLLVALPAAAQYNDPCGAFRDSNCITVQDPMGGAPGGGNYSYCVALSSSGQMCQDVVTWYSDPGTACADGCNICASVKYSASCQCDASKLQTSGTCTYW